MPSYLEPLSAAFSRMRSALFRPFDFGIWFTVGFAAWIAGWGAGGGSGVRGRFPNSWVNDDEDLDDVLASVLEHLKDLWADPFSRTAIIAGLFLLVVLVIFILWLNCRGEFVFLDAVVHKRQAIAAPWKDYRDQGWSLFRWQLVFTLITLPMFLVILYAAFVFACGGELPRSIHDVPWLPVMLTLITVWLPLALIAGFIQHFLKHFVTPLMYRDKISTNDAWRKFLRTFREHPFAFLLYGLFVFVLQIGLFVALIPVICLTCCLLACFLAVPYINAVVWLPVSYTFRGLGPEFLRQFGDDYSLWPVPVPLPEPAPEPADSCPDA